LELVEDVLFDKREDATERLINHAEKLKGTSNAKAEKDETWRKETVEERLKHALSKNYYDYSFGGYYGMTSEAVMFEIGLAMNHMFYPANNFIYDKVIFFYLMRTYTLRCRSTTHHGKLPFLYEIPLIYRLFPHLSLSNISA
jgi:hypothetical protein